MNLNEYQYGDAAEVADALNTDPDVTQNSLHSALINAMTRISRLEKQVEKLETENKKNIKALADASRE